MKTVNWSGFVIENPRAWHPACILDAERIHLHRRNGGRLDDTVFCLQRGYRSWDPRARRLAAEAEQWLFSDDQGSLVTFLNFCSVLDLDPTYLRSGVQQWRHQQRTCPQKKPRRAR